MPKIISGRVVGVDGAPVAGAKVMFAYGPDHKDIAEITGANGAFSLEAPVDGTYGIKVNAPGANAVVRDVQVRGQSPASIEVVVGRGP